MEGLGNEGIAIETSWKIIMFFQKQGKEFESENGEPWLDWILSLKLSL